MSSVCLSRIKETRWALPEEVQVVAEEEEEEAVSKAGLLPDPGVVEGLVLIGFVFSDTRVMCVPMTMVLLEPRDPMSI